MQRGIKEVIRLLGPEKTARIKQRIIQAAEAATLDTGTDQPKWVEALHHLDTDPELFYRVAPEFREAVISMLETGLNEPG